MCRYAHMHMILKMRKEAAQLGSPPAVIRRHTNLLNTPTGHKAVILEIIAHYYQTVIDVNSSTGSTWILYKTLELYV